MRSIFSFAIIVLAFSFSAFAQEKMGGTKPTDDDKTAAIPSDSYLKRGAPVGSAKKVSLAKVMKDPAKYAGKMVRVEGVIVRSCKTEGCWAELAPKADAKSVRVKMKDHKFFIPLKSEGAIARAEGVFTVKTLSKAEVDHMIEDDGAKFPNRNADGTVSEISFEATGIELRKDGK
ncbi:MAG: DUF4920 domain-containing protein [Pyrinomonadaceae bacterium]|nr:DUF4920 domain-containing protein [Acidobacteriota bacterium]MBK7935004.1 DUF4920 domain-containing protein [Acidobacteriota bacterium]MBP7377255.1 DUF4920 domain-containing protein [Pyrinomonadaceae bacterium]